MYKLIVLLAVLLSGCSATFDNNTPAKTVTFASFNVSMEARNYVDEKTQPEKLAQGQQLLMKYLTSGTHPQIHNVAEIIQLTRPDIILLNEFDYIDNPKYGVRAFIDNYLAKSHNGSDPIDYPYVFYAQSNTGLPTTFDLNNDDKAERFGADAYGFGMYAGHYGMVLLSRYPIVNQDIRTFQRFLWSDMPNALKPIDPATGQPFYSELEWANMRLSSKSHWDIPVNINGEIIHVLASHPTPPVFDGPEDRNGKRNHDEIRLWSDYITPQQGDYIYDDRGVYGGLVADAKFVVMGDQNATTIGGNAIAAAIAGLLNSPMVNQTQIPASAGAKANKPNVEGAEYHTSSWGARVDYVIPSKQLVIKDTGVFWPTQDDELFRLVKDRASSSDHRLVWVKVSW